MATATTTAAAATATNDNRSWTSVEATLSAMLKALPEGASRSMVAPHVAKLFEIARSSGIGALRGGVDWVRDDQTGALTSVRVLLEGRDADGVMRTASIELGERAGCLTAIEVPLSSASGCGAEPRMSGLSAQGREQLKRQNAAMALAADGGGA